MLSVMSTALTAFEKSFTPKFEKLIAEVRDQSAYAAVKALKKGLRSASSLRVAAPTTGFQFDKTNPKAVDWIKEHAAEVVGDISESTREDIKRVIEAAFTEQFDVDDLTDEIADLIGDDNRADLIARTETMKASNAGQAAAWDQAVEEGVLTGEETQEWITTPDDRLCPICEPMDGKQAPLGGFFDVDGDQVDGPPAHPRCRCTIGLTL